MPLAYSNFHAQGKCQSTCKIIISKYSAFYFGQFASLDETMKSSMTVGARGESEYFPRGAGGGGWTGGGCFAPQLGIDCPFLGCHDLPKRTGRERNRPKRTYENTESFYGYQTDRNGLQWVLQLIPKRTSMRTRKDRVGYDRNNPNKSIYVSVCLYVCR